MDLTPPDVQFRRDQLVVSGDVVVADDIAQLTYWTRARANRRGKVKELTHKFHLRVNGASLRFDVRVQPHSRAIALTQAKLAASIVAWLQRHVEGRLRDEQVARVRDGDTIRIGDLVVSRDGFGEHSVLRTDGPDLVWSSYKGAHVSYDSIDIILTDDANDAEGGHYAFSVRRSVLNSVMLPEVLAAVKDLSTLAT